MSSKDLPVNSLEERFYKGKKFWILKIVFISFFAFLIGVAFNFPVKKVLENKVISLLNSNRSCPISYKDLHISFLPPRVELEKPVIPGFCFKNPNTELKLNKMNVKLALPGVSPLGFKIHAQATSPKSKLNIYPLIGFGTKMVRLTDSVIDAALIQQIANLPEKMISGEIKADALLNVEEQDLTSGNILFNSQDFRIKSTSIQGFIIPNMPLNKLNIAGTVNKPNNINIKALEIGDDNSPIIARFKGDLTLNLKNVNSSNLSLTGEIKFSESFIESMSILNVLLNGKKKVNGFYRLKVSGPLNRLTNFQFF